MKRLKTISKYSLLILLVVVLYSMIYINLFADKSEYSGNEKVIKGYIREIKGNYYVVKGKEKIILRYYGNTKLQYNDYILMKGYLEKPRQNTTFNTFNYKKYLNTKRIIYIFNSNNIKVINRNNNIYFDLKNVINNKIEKYKSKKYLKVFIMGDKSNIDSNTKVMYKNLGIIHLFSISGTYISIIILLLNKVLKTKYKNYIICFFLLFYIVLTDFQISIIRSSLCYILFMLNKKFKLEIENKNIILLLASFLLIINPFYLYDIGFLLSFIISYTLINYSYMFQSKNYLYKSFLISLVSFFSSLPIIINTYYSINLLSVLWNLIFVPFSSLILFPLSFFTFIFPALDNLYSFLIDLFEMLSSFLNNINIFTFSFSKIPIILIMVYYYFLFTKKNQVIILLIIFFYFINSYSFTPKLYFIDVGQGDSSLIRIKNKNILIDTGGNYKYDNINNYFDSLKSIGVKRIDCLILTHGDFDHMGESIDLINNFKVKKVIFNCGELNDLEIDLIKVLNNKKINYETCISKLNVKNYKLYFLHTREYNNENDNSNVIYTEINGYKFMFMGDASTSVEQELLNEYTLDEVDVLKVGHHGSRTSSCKGFINEINPKYSIISVGKNNRYGHPNKEVLDNLEKSKIYRTDQDGSIMFKIKNNKLRIETCSP